MNNQYPNQEHSTQLAPDEAAGAALYFLGITLFTCAVGYGGIALFNYILKIALSTP